MSWIQNLYGRVFNKKGDQLKGDTILGLTGKPVNPLYCPKPKRDDFFECERIMDDFMTARGYRKYLAGDNIPRPKRRFLRKKERMNIGDIKTMFRVTKFKK